MAHISYCMPEANSRLRQLYPVSNKSSIIDINWILIIYKTHLRSLLTYASPPSSYAAQAYINQLQTFHNTATE